jgi:threonine dehydratase
MKIYEDITKTVGRTPLVRLHRIAEGVKAQVVVKVESFNPLSSIKDRIGVAMIDDAEKRGLLKKGKRKHGHRTGLCGGSQGIQTHPHHARHDEHGTQAASADIRG